MAGNRHAEALSPENDEMAGFISRKKPEANRLSELKDRLALATQQPDNKPLETAARQAEPEAQERDIAPAAQHTPPTAPNLPEAVQSPAQDIVREAQPQAPINPRSEIQSDEVSYSIPAAQPSVNKGGRPLMGKARKVERTVSMDKPLDKLLERLSNYEGLRLDRNVSTASVCVHLMLYGLSHVRDNAVFPTQDGKGLQIDFPAGEDSQITKALREIITLASQEAAQ